MTFFISPAVSVQEIDTVGQATEVSNNIAALAGTFNWGPVDKPYQITNGETELASVFSQPTDANYLDFLVAADFLSYAPSMYINRGVGPLAKNAVNGQQTPVLVKNSDDLDVVDLAGIDFLAKYPGVLGNGLAISVADSASFANWEFAGSFQYSPIAGEYAVAVVDGSGQWTGAGAQVQTEKLYVSGTAEGGTPQTQTLTISGTATGGVKQIETLSFTGQATGTTVTVDGNPVTVAVGDTAAVVAGKVATALAAVPSTYASISANGANVQVIFTVPAARTKIAQVSQNGISATSVINTVGNSSFNIPLYGETIALTNGDTAAIVAGKIATVFGDNTAAYEGVSNPTSTTVQYSFVDVQAVATTPTQTVSGVTIVTAITTAAVTAFSINVFGATVALTNGDTASVVAGKIAAALNALSVAPFSNIVANGATVAYSTFVPGKAVAQTAPLSVDGLTFSVNVSSTGRLGTILEKYELLSNVKGSKLADGTSQYFADVINGQSAYVAVGDATILLTARNVFLAGGVDDNAANMTSYFQDFSNGDQYDINYILAHGANGAQVQSSAVTVAETRADCVVFVGPPMGAVVNNKGNEVGDILTWRNQDLNRDSTYTFNDSNWALVYDKYNDVNRWIPTVGGTAGLQARTTAQYEAWYSLAGYTRGQYNNYIKLGWSPDKPQRDTLYANAVNPVVNFPGDGIILFGDKMSTNRPSNFGYMNVRQSFIIAEKSISTASKYFLFEINDTTTQTQFLNAVRPLLRSMQSRRAFENVQVVCDPTNNDGGTRQAKKLVGTIYLQPTNSINFVVLQFNAVGSGVTFTDVTGSSSSSSTTSS